VKVVAVCLGVLALAGTIILAIANASSGHSNAMGPLAFLCCILAVVVMIILGVTLGGRGSGRSGHSGPEPAVHEANPPSDEGDR
jgi:hypothetical protein